MTDTINNQIPFVPENTIDPAAGLNIALNTIDALLQVLVQSVGDNAPPAGFEGQRYIVGTAPTGLWSGHANKLARFLDGAWQFYEARYALNAADGAIWVRSGLTWSALSGGGGGVPADGSITNTKLANVPSQTIKGRSTPGVGSPEDLNASQARSVMGLSASDSPTFTSVTLSNGQLVFPATQVPSANANTLDDYEEGTWTPVLTFSTPGNLSVSYNTQSGIYTKIGNRVLTDFLVETSVFSHTTASGNCIISGFPFTIGSGNGPGPLRWSGITKAGHTSIVATGIAGTGTVQFRTSGSGLTTSNLLASDMPSGGPIFLFGQLTVI